MTEPKSPAAPPARLDRRRFTTALAAALGHGLVPGALRDALAADAGSSSWLADVDGNGRIDEHDRELVARGLRGQRGLGLRPSGDYDFRADLLATGTVDRRDLKQWERLRENVISPEIVRRPITVGWHYGWYHRPKRTRQTCQFLGGDYVSWDARTEDLFGLLKNECGLTVDALSWISPVVDGRTLANYRSGYMRSKRLSSRYTAALYESRICLPREDERIDFRSLDVRGRLVEDFALLGQWFRELEEAGGRTFLLDNRPVVFLYASHSFVLDMSSKFEFRALDDAIAAAMSAFHTAYGNLPFLVGEELPLAPGDQFSPDREKRTRNFDAVFVYHHAAHPTNIIHGGKKLGTPYAKAQQELLRDALPHVRSVENRFTDREVLLIPSLAAGFAKNGFRKLLATRKSYANYLRDMHRFLDRVYYSDRELVGRVTPAPVYTVGSWNEEFEGHSLFPYSFNRSMKRTREGGFDLSLALKEVFGWNVYARRPIG